MDQTTTETRTVPRGVPPEQPVELVRVTRSLIRWGVAVLALIAGLLSANAWLLWNISRSDEARRVEFVQLLTRIAEGK